MSRHSPSWDGGVSILPSSPSLRGPLCHMIPSNVLQLNPTAIITHEVPRSSEVFLKVYDTLGREMRTIVSDFQEPGTYSVVFRARDLPGGVYSYDCKLGRAW